MSTAHAAAASLQRRGDLADRRDRAPAERAEHGPRGGPPIGADHQERVEDQRRRVAGGKALEQRGRGLGRAQRADRVAELAAACGERVEAVVGVDEAPRERHAGERAVTPAPRAERRDPGEAVAGEQRRAGRGEAAAGRPEAAYLEAERTERGAAAPEQLVLAPGAEVAPGLVAPRVHRQLVPARRDPRDRLGIELAVERLDAEGRA